MTVVSLRNKLAAFSDHWSPKIVGELNGQYVKLVKFQGEYVWHHHASEDEMFLVIAGQFDLHFREPLDEAGRDVGSAVRTNTVATSGPHSGPYVGQDRVVTLREGEFCIVPRGVEHKPVAEHECSVMLFEPAATRNTGNVDHAYTIEADSLHRI
ncbi:MAG: cupin domain-containing protein [Planctomycetes bacterium]|nr:cupin domain-containing protein [Planctomycetota bacterium]